MRKYGDTSIKRVTRGASFMKGKYGTFGMIRVGKAPQPNMSMMNFKSKG